MDDDEGSECEGETDRRNFHWVICQRVKNAFGAFFVS